jgi:hypothetical protein
MLQNHQQQPAGVPSQIEIEDRPSPPLLTAVLIFGILICYVMAGKSVEFFLAHNGWQAMRISELLKTGGFEGIGKTIGIANLASFNMVHMALSIYFFSVFGAHLEARLGSGRFLLLLLAAFTLPMIAMQFDAMSTPTTTYFGSLWLDFAFIGGYLVLPPVPLKKFGGGQVQHKNQIFRREERADPRSKWIRNPWIFVGVFAVCQIFFHFWATTGVINPLEPGKFLLPPLSEKGGELFDTFRLLPALVALGCGYGCAQMAVHSAGQAYKEGPMVVAALKRYRELLDLDVKHEEALRGTARTLGLSYEKVRDMIQRNKGKLRVK